MKSVNRVKFSFMHLARNITVVLILAVLMCTCAFASYASTGNEKSDGLDIEITLDKEKYSEGDPVVITLSITNNTGKKIENVSARYYIPDCLEIDDDSVTEFEVLNSHQTVRSQINAVAKTNVGSKALQGDTEKDYTVLYIIFIILSIIAFVTAVTFLIIRERNRRKISATISFVFALIFCFSVFSSVIPVSAGVSDPVFADDISYEDAKEILSAILPEDYTKIIAQLSHDTLLTREKAAIITSIMILGKNGLPEKLSKAYSDVPSDNWRAYYIDLAVSNGIIFPVSSNIFDPYAEVSGYGFVEYALRASGFGANGEYKGQNGRASVISDALSLQFAGAEELLKEDTLKCSEALCFALKIMLHSSVQSNENGEYVYTKRSLISEFDSITEKKAIASGENTLVNENGEKITVTEKVLENSAYNVVYLNGTPFSVAKDFSTIDYSLVPIYSGKESRELGVGIEYQYPKYDSIYDVCKGTYDENADTGSAVFTSNNIHYSVNENAFENTKYMLDAKITDKTSINYENPVIFIAETESSSAHRSIPNILYVYQLSSYEPADYTAFSSALETAKQITNDESKFRTTEYETFRYTINIIDSSLAKDLTDTKESRAIIAQAEKDIKEAVEILNDFLLESYAELDAEIARAETYLEKEDDYTKESFTRLKEALENAKSFSRELLISDDSKAEIKACKDALTKAIDGLTESKYCDYTRYNDMLAIARSITNTNGKYPESEFTKFRNKVNSINNGLKKNLLKNDANQKTVDDATAAIQSAIDDLNAKVPCTYVMLDAAIAKAEALINGDTGDKNHRWNTSAFKSFTSALKDAKNHPRNQTQGYGSTAQQTIDSLAATLVSATDTLLLEKYQNKPLDMTAFESALSTAKNLPKDGYTDASYTLLQETLVRIDVNLKANGDFYNCGSTSCSKCNKSKELVKTAMSDIEKAVNNKNPETCDYTKLDEKIAAFKALDKTAYTEKSFAALEIAIADAEMIDRNLLKDIYGENQRLVDREFYNIEDAEKALVEITVEKYGEIVYSQSKLYFAGNELAITDDADFSAFTEKTLAKVTIKGNKAASAEALTSISASVLLSGDSALYKENAESEEKLLSASATVFEAEDETSLLTLEKLLSVLKASDAASSYSAKLYLDGSGKLIACKITE